MEYTLSPRLPAKAMKRSSSCMEKDMEKLKYMMRMGNARLRASRTYLPLPSTALTEVMSMPITDATATGSSGERNMHSRYTG